ncbi:hypothetical protein ABB55_03230 [Prosthecomicrobium hirschii]|uniref:Uncharacterized protein n=1 Tax=Prosthecodimorpha hirschii TaxID=665126 RepID=A0A0P6VZY5_9HYPH|nr:hypothetical protein [Prosthecomicrobium hirschii]KPL51359.1 hypothetical protein ABB55_03230 [Prosthecomicrobium hirschii]
MSHSFSGKLLYAALDVAEAGRVPVSVVTAIASKWPASGYRFESNHLRPDRLVMLDLSSLGSCRTFTDALPADFAQRLAALDKLDAPSGRFVPLNGGEAQAERARLNLPRYPALDFERPDPSPARQRDSLGRLAW